MDKNNNIKLINMAKRQYDDGEIIIHWDSDLCTHAGVCCVEV